MDPADHGVGHVHTRAGESLDVTNDALSLLRGLEAKRPRVGHRCGLGGRAEERQHRGCAA